MPKYARAICRLRRDTNLPEDDVVNVWHFDGDDSQTWAEDQDDLAERLRDFYLAIQTYLARTLSGALNVRIYDLEQPEPRVPRYEANYTITPNSSVPLPSEVAVCLSMQATPTSGIPQARRRGRVYIGPLANGVLSNETAGQADPAIAPAFVTALANAAAAMAIGPDPGDFRLAVYSPTIHASTGSLDQAFNDVTSGWIDNAWDVQRRRGSAPTTRTLWTPTP